VPEAFAMIRGGEPQPHEGAVEEELRSWEELLREGKAFIMRLVTFMDFKKVLERCFGSGACVIFLEVGRECGRRSCRRLQHRYSDVRSLLDALRDAKRGEKWGDFRFHLDLGKGTGTVAVYDGFEAREYGPSTSPVCFFTRGFLEGFLSEAFGKPLKVVETKCIAQGHGFCEFAVSEAEEKA